MIIDMHLKGLCTTLWVILVTDIVTRTIIYMMKNFMPLVGRCLPCSIMKVLQIDHFDEVNHRSRTYYIGYIQCWGRVAAYELLTTDLSVVEKQILVILMNRDNKTVTVKVNNAKDNTKPWRYMSRDDSCSSGNCETPE